MARERGGATACVDAVVGDRGSRGSGCGGERGIRLAVGRGGECVCAPLLAMCWLAAVVASIARFGDGATCGNQGRARSAAQHLPAHTHTPPPTHDPQIPNHSRQGRMCRVCVRDMGDCVWVWMWGGVL